MDQIMREKMILAMVSNIKISSHNEDITNVSFSILEILQSCLRRIWINVNWSAIEEGNIINIPMIKNVLL